MVVVSTHCKDTFICKHHIKVNFASPLKSQYNHGKDNGFFLLHLGVKKVWNTWKAEYC